jgi:hypothetical protein
MDMIKNERSRSQLMGSMQMDKSNSTFKNNESMVGNPKDMKIELNEIDQELQSIISKRKMQNIRKPPK